MLDFAPEHAHSYNELIEVVKLNLLLADWNDEDHNESLLSVRNSKWGKEMLRNVRYGLTFTLHASPCDRRLAVHHMSTCGYGDV